MIYRIPTFCCLLLVAFSLPLIAQEVAGKARPAKAGSKKAGSKKAAAPNPPSFPYQANLPNVLIIGDSISIGYTPGVQQRLVKEANVRHSPGNSQGTTHGLAELEAWLTPWNGKPWDVIHFNWGLHDLKRVQVAGTSVNSNDPKDPYQADLVTYEANLRKLVAILQQTKAQLIFATTTPFPAGVKPYRSPEDVARYNQVAQQIMKEQSIPINDLHDFIAPQLATLQQPINVHFTKAGSEALAGEVAAAIRQRLAANAADR